MGAGAADQRSERLISLLHAVAAANPFYISKWREAGVDPASVRSVAELVRLPFTIKPEFIRDQSDHPPHGRNRTAPATTYIRMHQTSGTSSGRPMRWWDTAETWQWMLRNWQISFPLLGLKSTDRLFFPFSFGPFIGFWTAFEAASQAGHVCLPGGGMTSTARLRFMIEQDATVVFATPTYALHLAEVAIKEGIDLKRTAVRSIVVAGEPGGNIPATRSRIEELWGARILDHYGMTEVGPVAFETESDPGHLCILETEHIAEIIDPHGTDPVPPGQIGELVLTNLGRAASPAIRYRTGDLVRVSREQPRGVNDWLRLDGGILGRVDDMIHVRGNNLYPAAIEAVVRRFPDVAEFRIVVDRRSPLADLILEIEPRSMTGGTALAAEVARAVRDEFLFRVDVVPVPVGHLPRFEMKARRVVEKT